MIEVKKDSEFTVLVADLIEFLSGCEEFVLKVWLSTELPLILTDEYDFLFMQEGLKITTSDGKKTRYIWYDEIKMFEVIK